MRALRVGLITTLCGVLLNACSWILPAPAKKVTYYRLAASKCENASVTSASSKLTLLLRPAYVSGLLAGRKLLFSANPGTLAAYQFAAWADPLSEKIPQLLLQQFECNADFSSVTLRSSLTHADLLLNLELLEFQHDVSDSNNHVLVGLRCELIDLKVRQQLGAKVFNRRLAAPSRDADGALVAFNQAMGELVNDIRDWTVAEVRE